jgi:hypothetical protein
MKPQPLVSMTHQRHPGDCGVAALAMFLGTSYEDALLALSGEVPTVLRRGVWMPELQRAAARVGVTTKLKRRYDLELDEGILQIVYKPDDQHVVVLREGLLFDTDLTCWKPEDYFKAKRAKAGTLIVRVE